MKRIVSNVNIDAMYSQVAQIMYDIYDNKSKYEDDPSVTDVQDIVKEHMEWLVEDEDWLEGHGQPPRNWRSLCDKYVIKHYDEYFGHRWKSE